MLEVIKFSNHDMVIKTRKIFQGQQKPRLYMWDLTDNKYISSLYKTNLDGVFLFEFNGKFYNIDLITKYIEERERKAFPPNTNRGKGQNLSPDKDFQE